MPDPDGTDTLDDAVRRGDLDELIRRCDGLAARRAWDELEMLRERCERAHETGRQLWPAAAHAAYRLALDAPPAFAGAVLVEGAGRFALGPLPEVAAQDHAWRELAPHVLAGAPAVVTAHERVVRGEDCTGHRPPGPAVLDLPLRLAAWEPRYSVAQYRPHTADFPAPDLPPLESVELPKPSAMSRADEGCDALRDLVRVWTVGSDGRADAVVVPGGAEHAIAALGPRAARAAELEPVDAIALMAWAGASGGAHGRRPGAAAGRFAAWWVVATLGGLAGEWPPDVDRLGASLSELRWMAWRADEPTTGWRLQLAVEHPGRAIAWAIAAVDAA